MRNTRSSRAASAAVVLAFVAAAPRAGAARPGGNQPQPTPATAAFRCNGLDGADCAAPVDAVRGDGPAYAVQLGNDPTLNDVLLQLPSGGGRSLFADLLGTAASFGGASFVKINMVDAQNVLSGSLCSVPVGSVGSAEGRFQLYDTIRYWMLRFDEGDHPASDDLVVHRTAELEWVVASTGAAQVLSAPLKGKVVTTDYGTQVLPFTLTVSASTAFCP
jgi:hypothetical protein